MIDPIEAQLGEQLVQALAGWEPPPFERLTVATRAEKWRSASAVQKAIRRGDAATALTHAHALHDREPRYLRRRLPIIALEDRAHGDERLVAQVMWAARHAARRGPEWWEGALTFMVVRLARGPKDRSPCDAGVAAAHHPTWLRRLEDWQHLPAAKLVQHALQRPHPVDRVLALRVLHGRREKAVLHDLATDLGLTPVQRVIAARGAATEGLGVPFIITAAIVNAAGEVTVEPDEPLVDLPPIGTWPSYCLDAHNWDGRRAVRQLLRTAPGLRACCDRWGVDPRRRPALVEQLLFRVEGDAVDRRLVHPHTRALRRLAAEACVAWAGAPIDALDEGLEVLRAHMPALHRARRRVLSAG